MTVACIRFLWPTLQVRPKSSEHSRHTAGLKDSRKERWVVKTYNDPLVHAASSQRIISLAKFDQYPRFYPHLLCIVQATPSTILCRLHHVYTTAHAPLGYKYYQVFALCQPDLPAST